MPYRFWHKQWWLEGAHRWQIVAAFGVVVAATSVGAAANAHLTHELTDNNAATIQTLCNELQKDRVAFRGFVLALIAGSPEATQRMVLGTLDQFTPEQRTCAQITAEGGG